METQIRRVPLLLPTRDYEALRVLAETEERTPSQQAAYMLRRSLESKSAGLNPAVARDHHGPGEAA